MARLQWMIASIHFSLMRYSQRKWLFTDKFDRVNREALCDIISILGFLFLSPEKITFRKNNDRNVAAMVEKVQQYFFNF